MSFKMTKIIATLGPASSKKKTIKELVQAGVNVFRLNLSHGNHAGFRQWIQRVHQVERELKTFVAIILDLQGPKIRVGEFENGFIHLNPGARVTFTTRNVPGKDSLVPVRFPEFSKVVQTGDMVYLNDGNLCVQVLGIEGKEVAVEVRAGGILSNFKGLNLPDTVLRGSPITAKDKKDLQFGLREGVDFVALSFVGSAKDIHQLRRLVRRYGGSADIIAKIERKVAVENYKEIIEAADGVMVARGDLGIEIPLTDVPVVQHNLLRECAAQHKPAIVATQMLESMIENNRPTRAEVSDIATAVLECADAVMLSAETASGKHPVAAVKIMAETSRKMEAYQRTYQRREGRGGLKEQNPPISEGITFSANRMVDLINAQALIAFTLSGGTARMIAAPHPNVPILVFTSKRETARRVTLLRGVVPFLIEGDSSFLGSLN
ncbi:MAG: pyruvate kinase, partial [Nitrospinaceae bacterium]